tara:strand:+ start:7840 stop:10044 length:2205 start_codon:yes stop_codon:yes gene_type:complete
MKRINTSLLEKDYNLLRKETKEVLGQSGALYPPFGQLTTDYVEFHVYDTNNNFKNKDVSKSYEIVEGNFILKPGADLRDSGYSRGNYVVRYYFYRPLGGADEVVLTKTVDNVGGTIHSGNPEITGVPMGEFYVDGNGDAFVGPEQPTDGTNGQELVVTEFKFFIDEISSSRTELRVAPQQINNINYLKQFSKLSKNIIKYYPKKSWTEYVDNYPDLAQAWGVIEGNPNSPAALYWIPRGGTTKAGFGEAHWITNGESEGRLLPNEGGGGQVSWTGPDSSQIEFNTRLETDDGFQEIMQDGKLIVKDAFITGYEERADVEENGNYSIELPIPESYIEAQDLQELGFPMSVRYIIKEELSTKTIYGHGFDGYAPIPNLTTPGVRYHFDFGCGHTETTDQPFANHTYDSPGLYNPVVTILTPNFTLEVSDLYRNVDGNLDGPGLRGSQLNGYSPTETVSEEDVNVEGGVQDDELPMASALDGKIIKWNGNEGPAPFYSVGGSKATVGTIWYVQNGHTRAIASAINTPLRILLGLRKQIQNNDGELITVNDLSGDIALPLSVLNTMPIGPNLDQTNFANSEEDELKRNLEGWYDGDQIQIDREAREALLASQTETQDESGDEFDDEEVDNEETQGSGGVLTLVNSPIEGGQFGTAASKVRFLTPTSTSFVSTQAGASSQLTFTANTMVQVRGEPTANANEWGGWYADPEFELLVYDEQNPQFLLTENVTLYAKVESGV